MKKIYLLIFFFNAFASLKSQLKVNMGEGTLGAGKVNWVNQFIILDKNGGMFHSYYEGVDGHPYFQESFKWATVKLSSGETFNNVSARLDIYKQMVQIKLNGD